MLNGESRSSIVAITIRGETTMRINRLYAGGSTWRVFSPSFFLFPFLSLFLLSPSSRSSSVSSYKANIHISRPLAIAAVATVGLPKNSGPSDLFLVFPLSLSLSVCLFLSSCLSTSFVSSKHSEDRVRKCVSGMMHGRRDQKQGRSRG